MRPEPCSLGNEKLRAVEPVGRGYRAPSTPVGAAAPGTAVAGIGGAGCGAARATVSTRVSNLRLVSFPLMVMLIEMVADLLTKEGAVGAKWRQTTQARQFQDVTTSEVGFQFMLQTLLGQGIIELAYAVAKPVLDKLNLWPWWDLGENVRQHTAHAVAPPAAEAQCAPCCCLMC